MFLNRLWQYIKRNKIKTTIGIILMVVYYFSLPKVLFKNDYATVIESKEGRKISLDIHIPLSKKRVPVVVFCHGFKGFKDWGHFNWVAESCMPYEMAFLKFNFSFSSPTFQSLLLTSLVNIILFYIIEAQKNKIKAEILIHNFC